MFVFSYKPYFYKQRKKILNADSIKLPDLSQIDLNKSEQLSDEIIKQKTILKPIIDVYLKHFIFIFCISLVIELSILITPFLAQTALKNKLSEFNAILIIISFLFLIFFSLLSKWYRNNKTSNLSLLIRISITRALTNKILHIPYLQRQKLTSGELKNLIINDTEQIQNSLEIQSWSGLPAIIIILCIFFYTVFFAENFIIISVLSSLTIIPISSIVTKYMEKYAKKSRIYKDDLYAVTGEWVQNSRISRMMNLDIFFTQKISCLLKQETKKYLVQHIFTCLIFSLSFIWYLIPLIVTYSIAKIFKTNWSMNAILLGFWVTQILAEKIRLAPMIITDFMQFKISMNRIYKLLAVKVIYEYLNNEENYLDVINNADILKIKLTNLIIKNNNDDIILNVSDLILDLTQKNAIIGQTGGGKTVLLNCILGEIIPVEGNIELLFKNRDNQQEKWCNIKNVLVWQKWREYIAFIPQNPFIAATNIYDNVAFFAQEDDYNNEQNVLQSLYDAALSEDLELFKTGMTTKIGELGVNLSGGQKQRLSIARAFFVNRPLLILDDPLSAVDSKVEKFLIEQINIKTQAFILATHRLNILEYCNNIIVVEKFHIVEKGNYQNLLNTSDSILNTYILEEQL